MLFKSHTFHQHVIHITFHDLARLVFEHFIHHPLICCPYILQTEMHSPVAVGTSFGYEGRVLFVSWMHRDLIISKVCIQWIEKLIPRCWIHQFIYLGKGVAILRAGFVQVCEVHTHSLFVVGLLYHHNIDEPFEVCHLMYEPYWYKFIHLFRYGILPISPYISLFMSYWRKAGVYIQPMWSYQPILDMSSRRKAKLLLYDTSSSVRACFCWPSRVQLM